MLIAATVVVLISRNTLFWHKTLARIDETISTPQSLIWKLILI
jgi:hypothetical protein